MPNQYEVDIPRCQSTVVFTPYRDPGGLLSRNDKPRDIWNTQGISGYVFANPPASSSSLDPRRFNPWISNVTENTSPHITTERQIRHSLEPHISVRTASQKMKP